MHFNSFFMLYLDNVVTGVDLMVSHFIFSMLVLFFLNNGTNEQTYTLAQTCKNQARIPQH